MRRSLEIFLALLLSTVACFGQECRKPGDPTPTSVKVGAFDPKGYEGWKKIQTNRFSFYLPSEASGGMEKSIEGGYYRFVGPDFILSVDINIDAGFPSDFERRFASFCEKWFVFDNYYAYIWFHQNEGSSGFQSGALFKTNTAKKLVFNMVVSSFNKEKKELADKIFRSVVIEAENLSSNLRRGPC